MSTSEQLTPEQAGALDEDAFVARFGATYEHAPWVAREAWRRRPFDSFETLVQAFESAVRDAPVQEQLALVLSHPELAGREAEQGALTEHSANEQAGAGLDRLSRDELERLTRINRAYREKFGFPMVVAVREHDKASILAQGEARLHNGREQEFATAIGEVMKIARGRLRELVRNSDAGKELP